MKNTPFEFIKDPKDIFKALLDSKDRGNAIGIKCDLLGKGMFVTGVNDILIGDGHENTTVILTGCDFTGHVLETNRILLTDIQGVCTFPSKFGNPVYETLNKILGR